LFSFQAPLCPDKSKLLSQLATLKQEIAFQYEALNRSNLENEKLRGEHTKVSSVQQISDCNMHSVRQCSQQLFMFEDPLSTWPNTQKFRTKYALIPDTLIDWRIDHQKSLWIHLKKWKSLYDTAAPFFENGMIPIEDDFLIFAMIMHFAPSKIVEIGSGFSTKTAHTALNALPGDNRSITCIEPFRYSVINVDQEGKYPVQIIKKLVQEVDDEVFLSLQSGDILFIDSSHVIQPFGDTILELIFILPRLADGVIVHIHDICLPENYPEVWLNDASKSQYTEQYMLGAFLYGNVKWKVLWANWVMGLKFPELFREIGLPGQPHGSFWIQKV